MRKNTTSSLVATGLKCIRNESILFQDISFSLNTGEVLQIEGPNGSGKTSLTRLLCGIVLPEEGEVRWNNENITNTREQYNAEISYIGHNNGIKTELTPSENLGITKSLVTASADISVMDALEYMNIPDLADIPVRKLSSGQCRRVALARLLMTKATLWLLDEPFTTLDENGRELVQTMLEQHTTDDGMVVIVTHEPLGLEEKQIHRIILQS